MTDPRLALLESAITATSANKVARDLGISSTAISLIRSGKYPASPETILTKVAELYSVETLVCPVLGEITLGRCADERRTPFSASSPQRVALFRACQQCTRRK